MPAIDGCWYWIGAINNCGYGRISIKHKSHIASRVSFELNKYKITNGMSVLHTCDNRACVNPDHLYLGTQKSNVKDMLDRNRWINKLSRSDVDAIKKSNDDYNSLAVKFDVSPRTIYKIKTGRSWL